jgi:hypothetical protein
MFHADKTDRDRDTDTERQTDNAELIGDFSNFVNAPKYIESDALFYERYIISLYVLMRHKYTSIYIYMYVYFWPI